MRKNETINITIPRKNKDDNNPKVLRAIAKVLEKASQPNMSDAYRVGLIINSISQIEKVATDLEDQK